MVCHGKPCGFSKQRGFWSRAAPGHPSRRGEYHEGDHGIKPSAGLDCGTGRSMAGSGAGSGSGLGISFAVQCCCQEAAKGARCGGTSCSSSGCHRWQGGGFGIGPRGE